jgi:long-chain acyl-CoA synthetase
MKDFTRLFDIIHYQNANFPKEDAICRKENGQWIKYSTKDVLDKANKASLAFLKLGLQREDKIAIVSTNRPEWNIMDLASLQAGLVNVPVYPTISESEYNFIFNDASIKYAFVEDQNLYNKMKAIQPNVPSLIDIYTFNDVPGAKNWKEFLTLGDGGDFAAIETIKDSIKPSDLATIIYTSGTTGNPKGVMLSHNNVVSNVKAVNPLLPLGPDKRILSFLPLCHIFERMVGFTYIVNGVSIYYAESMETIAENLKEVKPNFFTTVPRLLEKVYMKLEAAAANLDGFKKKLYLAALDFANNFEVGKKYGFIDSLKYRAFDKLIFSKWREALGGNVIGICTGAAKLNPKLAKVFTSAGIIVCEGYGQTESSPVITVTPFEIDKVVFGTVGVVIDGVEVKLDHREGMKENEGEIWCKGPNVMMGYYNRPDLTAETIQDGWLKTGDVGTFIDAKGLKYLKITDRVKEIFKTSGGKYIAPLSIESKMKEISFIEQMLVIGENKNYVSALIVPNFINLKEWCTANGVNVASNADIIKSEKVKALFNEKIEEKNKHFGQWETIKRFELLAEEWTVDGGELTPTMKVKRKVVTEKYTKNIEALYQG